MNPFPRRLDTVLTLSSSLLGLSSAFKLKYAGIKNPIKLLTGDAEPKKLNQIATKTIAPTPSVAWVFLTLVCFSNSLRAGKRASWRGNAKREAGHGSQISFFDFGRPGDSTSKLLLSLALSLSTHHLIKLIHLLRSHTSCLLDVRVLEDLLLRRLFADGGVGLGGHL